MNDRPATDTGALDDVANLPLLGPDVLSSFGRTAIIAPHPDDESLGCGGLIALLKRAGVPVRVIVTSDGTGSHPNSREYPRDRLRDLRETEARAAVTELGLSPEDVDFLRLPDTRVPHPGDNRFEDARQRMQTALGAVRPDVVLLPWRRDPHNDHRATWHIVTAAIDESDLNVRIIEYPIWVWDLGQIEDMPRAGEMRGWRLDISSVIDQKMAAISAHRSQTTDLIADDPTGFRLEPETLEHFQRPFEIFLEPAGA